MRIAIGCDDTGLALKEPLVAALEADGHDVLDLGTFSTDPVDYPDYARAVGQAVLRGFVDASLLLCASGTGGAIAANKMRGIRAATCPDADAARRSRGEVDANVLCLTAAGLEPKTAIEIAQAFIGAQFEAGDPQSRQVAKIGQLEAGLLGADKAPLKPSEDKGAPKASTAKPAAKAPAAAREPKEAPAPPPAPPRPAVTTPALVLPDPLKLPAVEETLRFLEQHEFLDRLWVKDATLWRGDAATVRNRLGWLTSPTIMRSHAEEHPDLRGRDPTAPVLAGGPPRRWAAPPSPREVLNETFGSKMGFPDCSCWTPRIPARSSRRSTPQPEPHALRRLEQVRHHDGDARRSTRSSAARSRPRHRRGPACSSSPSPTRGTPLEQAGDRDGLPPHLPEPRVHRRALLRALASSGSCPPP